MPHSDFYLGWAVPHSDLLAWLSHQFLIWIKKWKPPIKWRRPKKLRQPQKWRWPQIWRGTQKWRQFQKLKWPQKWRQPQKWRLPKYEDNLKNDDYLKNENNLKNENEQICYLNFMPVTSKSLLKTKFICTLPHTTVSCLFILLCHGEYAHPPPTTKTIINK